MKEKDIILNTSDEAAKLMEDKEMRGKNQEFFGGGSRTEGRQAMINTMYVSIYRGFTVPGNT